MAKVWGFIAWKSVLKLLESLYNLYTLYKKFRNQYLRWHTLSEFMECCLSVNCQVWPHLCNLSFVDVWDLFNELSATEKILVSKLRARNLQWSNASPEALQDRAFIRRNVQSWNPSWVVENAQWTRTERKSQHSQESQHLRQQGKKKQNESNADVKMMPLTSSWLGRLLQMIPCRECCCAHSWGMRHIQSTTIRRERVAADSSVRPYWMPRKRWKKPTCLGY